MTKKWYETILGIASAFVLLLTLTWTGLIYFGDGRFAPIFLVLGTILCLMYLLFHFMTEFLVNKKILRSQLVPPNIIKIILSFIFLCLPFLLHKIIIRPDIETKKKVAYILPENFRGQFTVYFKSSLQPGDTLIVDDTTVVYKITSSGIFHSNYAFIKQPDYLSPHFYIQTKNGLRELKYLTLPFGTPDSDLVVCDYDFHDNFFESRDYISFVLDSPDNFDNYDRLKYAREQLNKIFNPTTKCSSPL